MKKISTKVHGMADYPTNALIAASPYLLGFAEGGAETIIPAVVGGSGIVASMCTDYEMGLTDLIPMKSHLALDVANGLFLAISPWVFGFSKKVWAPHLILGLLEAGTALMTSDQPGGNPEGIEVDEETEDFLENTHLRGRARALANNLH